MSAPATESEIFQIYSAMSSLREVLSFSDIYLSGPLTVHDCDGEVLGIIDISCDVLDEQEILFKGSSDE